MVDRQTNRLTAATQDGTLEKREKKDKEKSERQMRDEVWVIGANSR